MGNKKFSPWMKWDDRNEAVDIENPGIYIIAIASKDMSGQDFGWIKEIVYVGMTNSLLGLRGRLYAFDRTIQGKSVTHGGADRFRYAHKKYDELVDTLYVSVIPFVCDVSFKDTKSKQYPENLRIKGEVAKFEYDCFASYVEEFKELPEFNNMKKSKKYSLEYKKGNIS